MPASTIERRRAGVLTLCARRRRVGRAATRGAREPLRRRARRGVTDTFGRPWREGLVEVAWGAGMDPLLDLRGRDDLAGRTLHHTVVALATRSPPRPDS